MFKTGNHVYDIRMGWGVIREIDEEKETYKICVDFLMTTEWYTLDGKSNAEDEVSLLKLKEYKLCEIFKEKKS